MFIRIGNLAINLGLVRNIIFEDTNGDVGLWYGEYDGHADAQEPVYEWVKGKQASVLRAYIKNNSTDLNIPSNTQAKREVDSRIPMTYHDMIEVIQAIADAQNRYDVPGLERAKHILDVTLELKMKGLLK